MSRSSLALVSTCLLLALPTVASAQAGPAVKASHAVWKQFTDYITKSAEQMPESELAYRPAASVRTFGQLVGHVAGAQQMICAMALGEKPAAEDQFEKTAVTKAALVQAMKSSSTYCERAYAQSDAVAAGMVDMFGERQSRLQALMVNAAHNGEHYGNIVTYLRMKGMVPPSSQQ